MQDSAEVKLILNITGLVLGSSTCQAAGTMGSYLLVVSGVNLR
jgi:hypothetical protein